LTALPEIDALHGAGAAECNGEVGARLRSPICRLSLARSRAIRYRSYAPPLIRLMPILAEPAVRRGLPCLLLLLLGSCMGYPARTEAAFSDFSRGHFDTALKEYSDPDTTGAPFLQWSESGMVALAAGDWKRATECLGKAAKVVEERERKALISTESAGETLLTWTISETLAAYEGEGYERVMLHASLAFAYLAQGLLEDARVELRQADALLETEEQLYSKDYRACGLAHYLSAVAYEIEGKPDEAYIDYKRMEATGVGPDLFAPALARLAQALDERSDLELWQQRYNVKPESHAGQASVVVIAGVGLGPYKEAITIPVPTGTGILQWSVPAYVTRPQPLPGVALHVDGSGALESVVVEDVARVSKENLDDRLAWLVAKSTVRAFLKRELTRELGNQHGDLGWLVGTLFTVATEQADLRAWQTLPNTWQAARAFVEPGIHELDLSAGSTDAKLGSYELQVGETLFVFARTLDERLYAHVIGGKAVEKGNP